MLKAADWAIIDGNNGDQKGIFGTKDEALERLIKLRDDGYDEAETWLVVDADKWMY